LPVIGLTRTLVDLADFDTLRRRFEADRPQCILHCAAMSKTNECQAHPELARKHNVEVTARLAELAADIPFLFFSTDLVFDGRLGNYDESAATNPLGIYAETKVAAERLVLANPKHTVVRTSLNGGASPTGNRGFNEEMRRLFQTGQTLRLFADEFRSPISASVTARAIWELVQHAPPGLYHLAGSERLSRYQIGLRLAARWPGLNPKIEAASLKEYQGAPRAPDTSLNSSKLQQHLSFQLPGLTEWLKENPKVRF
jgi:dTDP-4-dehydrorhamnose reductase